MVLYKIIYGLDAIAAIIILYFFLIGLGDGTVSGSNLGLWFFLLAGLTAILGGSIWLRSRNYNFLSFAVLLILAIPTILFGLYFLIAVTGNGRWN